LDIRGKIWEGEEDYSSLDAAFQALEAAWIKCMEENGFDERFERFTEE
jgi:hypothetical protein